MRGVVGGVIVVVCLGLLVHDAGGGRLSVFRGRYARADLDERLVDAAE